MSIVNTAFDLIHEDGSISFLTINLIKFLHKSNVGSAFGGDCLNKLGKLLHISSSRNLVLRAEVTPPIGAVVMTNDSREVGRVSDVFGPTKAPYVSVSSPSEKVFLQSLVGKFLFYEDRRGARGRRLDAESIPIRRK